VRYRNKPEKDDFEDENYNIEIKIDMILLKKIRIGEFIDEFLSILPLFMK
jgi:hypothetical protein